MGNYPKGNLGTKGICNKSALRTCLRNIKIRLDNLSDKIKKNDLIINVILNFDLNHFKNVIISIIIIVL